MNKEYNVLILSAGRRVELIQCFQNAAKSLNIKSKVIAGDCSNTAPAIYFADDSVILPLIGSENYISSIIDICNEKMISLIIPTIDTDLLLLSENKKNIEGSSNAKVLISNYSVIEHCRDKINFQNFIERNNFKIPKMYSIDELHKDMNMPLFIKPKNGSSSINTFKINNYIELQRSLEIVKEPIIQDCMIGDEYTVDCFLDFSSKVISVVPRLRMATRSGEVSKGKIIKDRDIINDVTKLLNILKPIGHITVQLMKTNKGIEYIEINPRFGGGAPISMKAGADSCLNLFKLLLDEKLEYNEDYIDNITALRYDACVFLDESMKVI